MKFLSILALVFSVSAMAEVLPPAAAKQVISATRDALAVKDLSCMNKLNSWTGKASEINWVVFDDASVTINEEGQPVLTIVKMSEPREYVAYVTTNDALTLVENIVIKTSSISKVRRNIGTIPRPRYEDVLERKLLEDIECK